MADQAKAETSPLEMPSEIGVEKVPAFAEIFIIC